MTIEILMPALSPTMTEGNLVRWAKKPGDRVRSGEVVAEIETDKATMEVEAADEGKLARILVPEGSEGVKVNTVIALLAEEGEDLDAIADAPAPVAAAPAAAVRAGAGASTAARSEPAVPAAGAPAPAGAGRRIKASPLARRLAAEAGLDLEALTGSGPHGRIVKADVEAAAARAPAAAVVEAAPAQAAPMPAGPIPPPVEPHEVVALTQVRRIIAQRLTEAKQTIPHFYLTLDCRLDALLDLRAKLNAREAAEVKLSVNDFVIKAAAGALKRHPACNAIFGGDRIYLLKAIDIAVAVAIEGGLITPIVRAADTKSLPVIAGEMKDLAARARAGRLRPEEFQGGGFSISNLGMYGIREFAAVINPPQASILAIGAGEKRPVVVEDALTVATMMTVTLSVDHRVIDGALGAGFLAEFKRQIEDPLGLLF